MTLTLEEISFVIRGRAVLSGVSVEIPGSGLTCLVGPNGAGKTTLLRLLAGELAPTSGRILLEGADVSHLTQKEIARHFSIIPQSMPAPPHLTVFELVSLARFDPRRALRWHLAGRDREVVEGCIKLCQIESLSWRRVEELSGGEQQRAWLAFGLAQGKRFLLLDETLDGLDVLAKQSFFSLLKEAGGKNRGIVLTSHDLDQVTEFAGTVIVLSGGRVVHAGPPGVDLRHLLASWG